MSIGGGPEEVAVPMSVRLQGEQAVARMKERKADGYVQLERKAIDDARKDRSGILAGRGNADLAALEMAGPRTGNAAEMMAKQTAIAASASNIKTQSKIGALNFQDQQKLAIAQTGAGKAHNSDVALNSLAGNQLNTAFTEAQNSILVSNSKAQAAMSVIEGVGAGALNYRGLADTKAGKFVDDKVYKPAGNWWNNHVNGGE